MTKLPLENINRIVTEDRIYNKITEVSEVYSNGIAFFLVVYEDGEKGAVRVDTIKNVDY